MSRVIVLVATTACAYYGSTHPTAQRLVIDTDSRHPCRVQGTDISQRFASFFKLITIHPINLLPPFASTISSNIADLFSKPLASTHHRHCLLAVGDFPATPTTLVVTATAAPTVVAPTSIVDSASTAVDSVSTPTSTSCQVYGSLGVALKVHTSCS